MDFLSRKYNINGRIFLTLIDYLVTYSHTYDKADMRFTTEINAIFPNGTRRGLTEMLRRQEIDIVAFPTVDTEESADIDFVYPFQLVSATFVTLKQEYKPEIFSIYGNFSWQLWLTILTVLMGMFLVHCVCLKKNHSLSRVSLHVFAVLLRQGSTLRPLSKAKNLLVYSWVVGAMFLCLAYDSVVLSFLTFPPINQIKDVSQLAKAVINGDYHCITIPGSAFYDQLPTSKRESLRIIGKDLKTNNLSSSKLVTDFLNQRINQKLAFIADENLVDVFSVGNKFVSEDRFQESMASMMVRKDFCCKKVIDTFVHRLMASGLYSKYRNDKSFIFRLRLLLKLSEKDTSKRKLTLIDVSSAFIFLITGYFVSFCVLIGEILANRWKKVNYCKKSKERTVRVAYKEN